MQVFAKLALSHHYAIVFKKPLPSVW